MPLIEDKSEVVEVVDYLGNEVQVHVGYTVMFGNDVVVTEVRSIPGWEEVDVSMYEVESKISASL